MKKFELTEEQLKRLIEVGMEIITDFKVTETVDEIRKLINKM